MRSQTNLGLRKWCTDGDTFFLRVSLCVQLWRVESFAARGRRGRRRARRFVKVTFFVIIKLERSLKSIEL